MVKYGTRSLCFLVRTAPKLPPRRTFGVVGAWISTYPVVGGKSHQNLRRFSSEGLLRFFASSTLHFASPSDFPSQPAGNLSAWPSEAEFRSTISVDPDSPSELLSAERFEELLDLLEQEAENQRNRLALAEVIRAKSSFLEWLLKEPGRSPGYGRQSKEAAMEHAQELMTGGWLVQERAIEDLFNRKIFAPIAANKAGFSEQDSRALGDRPRWEYRLSHWKKKEDHFGDIEAFSISAV